MWAMADSDEFEAALLAIARMEGKSVAEVKLEMLKERLGGVGRREPPPPVRGVAISRHELGDASAPLARSRRDAMVAHNALEFPGTPVVRHKLDHGNETPEEAMERWYEEETELPDGVHGLGGQSAGGIFGDGPIATSIYDPMAMGRAEARVSQATNVRMMQVLDKLERKLDDQERARLEGAQSGKRLTRGKR
jgi:hypothetical protein